MSVEFVLLVLSMLFFFSIIADKIGYRFGVPALLVFLAVGMLFGPDGVGKLINPNGVGYMLNISSAEALSSIALCVILFSGGMDTKLSDINPVMPQGVALATFGVLLTMGITGVLIYYIFGWINGDHSLGIAFALLIAATLSSTDSASVFSIMRTNGISFKHGLRPILELESGANGPMAYILTTTMIGVVKATDMPINGLEIIQTIVIQLVMGAVLGFAFGKGVVRLMREAHLTNESLYPIMVLTACIFIFSIAHYLKGNQYLAVYVGGLIIGNSKFTRKRQTKSFFDGLTWLSQLVMFLMLGLLVRPHEMLDWRVMLACVVISVVMIFISRPVAVFLCMAPFKSYNAKDKLMLSWVGLKGAVPIIFAIMCLSEGVPGSDILFNVIFLCTILSLLVQGTTITSMARKLNLAIDPPALKRLEHFDIDLPEEIQSSATECELTEDMLANGNRLRDLMLPSQTLVIMVRRGEDFFVPSGNSELLAGDQLLVITDNDVEMARQYQMEKEEEEQSYWNIRMLTDTKDFFQSIWHKIVHNN